MVNTPFEQMFQVRRSWNLFRVPPFNLPRTQERRMYSIVWLIGAVVIVIAILNLVGMA